MCSNGERNSVSSARVSAQLLCSLVLLLITPTSLRFSFTVLPIIAKLPLGLYVPRSKRAELPDDFPYNPYVRDACITGLAVMCRGEFNVIIASFALGSGLISPDIYAAIVFAVLLACIVSPLLLTKVIKYYNDKSKAYLAAEHPIQRDGKTCDGFRPLFMAIQARTPIHWGLQETFRKALETNDLIIIDHRSWHTIGQNSFDLTEIFVQDKKVRVRIRACFGPDEVPTRKKEEIDDALIEAVTEAENSDGISVSAADDVEDGDVEAQQIANRCEEITEGMGLLIIPEVLSEFIYLSQTSFLILLQC